MNRTAPGGKIVVQVEAHLRKIVPDFLAKRREDVESMQEALEQGDYESIRVFGHRMKGTGGSFGLDGIGEIGKSLEQAAKVGTKEEIRELLESFSTYLEMVEIV